MNHKEKVRFAEMAQKILNELGKKAAGKAAESLSELTGIKIMVKSPTVRIIEFEEINELFTQSEQLVSFTFTQFSGVITGTIALLFPSESTISILRVLHKLEFLDLHELDDMDYSILKETGNIILGAYINVLSNALNLTILPRVPDVAIDDIRSILNSLSPILYREQSSNVVLVETALQSYDKGNPIEGYLLIFLEPSLDSVIKILQNNEFWKSIE
ncbi:MAG: chemotaxis protein CheC [Bacteroidales bacterium]|nr:chemotaxis protein CheC [Bacteroidales bacterium]